MKMDSTADKSIEYKGLIKKRLSDYRYNHSVNVADAAVHLAEKYGADKKKAFIAGILHDIMKEETADIQIKYIEASGHKMTAVERGNHSVLHQMSGAAYCASRLHIDDADIINAVRYHTTGRAGMTLLEKVIYTADFISAERSYPDVDVMRKLAEESLESAMLYSLKYTIKDLVKREALIHPDTLNCYNDLLENYIEKE